VKLPPGRDDDTSVLLVNSDQIDKNWELLIIRRLRFGPVPPAFLAFLGALFRSRAALQFEIPAMRHQLRVFQRSVKRPKLGPADCFLWAWLSLIWERLASPGFHHQAPLR
jgi:hypothetical protein